MLPSSSGFELVATVTARSVVGAAVIGTGGRERRGVPTDTCVAVAVSEVADVGADGQADVERGVAVDVGGDGGLAEEDLALVQPGGVRRAVREELDDVLGRAAGGRGNGERAR